MSIMKSRRKFIKLSALGSAALVTTSFKSSKEDKAIINKGPRINKPIVVSTWLAGMQANAEAW